MAGVAAAHTLQAQGMQDFILLEASNRLGGRMSNVNFCGDLFIYLLNEYYSSIYYMSQVNVTNTIKLIS